MEWISVEDRLPEIGQQVLTVIDRSKREKHTIVEQNYRSQLSTINDNWMNTAHADKVTHWMPLPSPPKK